MPSFMSQMRLPEFHGDPQNYPNETWDTYEADLELAYAGSGVSEIGETMRKAHLLTGLRGPAARYLKLNPDLRTMPYVEALKTLRKYFRRLHAPGIEDLSKCRQRPGECVLEFVARLKDTLSTLGPEEEYVALTKREAKTLLKTDEGVQLMKDDEVEESHRTYRKMTEEMAKRLFLKGIRDEYKPALRNRMPQTLQEAIEIAEELEKYTGLFEGAAFNATAGRIKDVSRSSSPVQNKERNTVVEQAAEHLRALNDNPRKPRINRSSERESRPQSREREPRQQSREREPRRQSNEREPRYSKSSERTYSRDRYNDDRNSNYDRPYERRAYFSNDNYDTFRCYYCGRAGHAVRECRLRIDDESQRVITCKCQHTCNCSPRGRSMDHGPPMQPRMPPVHSHRHGENGGPPRNERGRRVTFAKGKTGFEQVDSPPSKNSRRPPAKGGSQIPPPFKRQP
jgi:hypothetical protein